MLKAEGNRSTPYKPSLRARTAFVGTPNADALRNKFIEMQMLIDALNRAISAEEDISPKG